MIINNAINSPLPTSLALGGMNAALTASNGGIFYSTASAGAILSGTATANQPLLSGSSSAPAWSTNTYPSTTNANELLYSSSTNVIGGLSTANSACLVSDYISFPVVIPYPVWSLPMGDGQIVIGGTSGRPIPFNITAGENVSIVNAPGSVTINSNIISRTASRSSTLDFNNVFNSNFLFYRIFLVNLLPQDNVSSPQLCLRFGVGNTPSYISAGYIYQILDVPNDGTPVSYPGYSGSSFSEARMTYAGNFGVANIIRYGGVCGYIDLFVTGGSSGIANGLSRLSYESTNNDRNYVNTFSTFQIPINDNYTSVQLFMSHGNLFSGTAYLQRFST